MFRSGDLSLLHTTSPDGNPCNPYRIMTSTSPRATEVEALLRLAFGAPIPAPTPLSARVMNGQLVDLATMLMCSTCGGWKADDAFRADARNARSRRGRSYNCRQCLSRSPMYNRPDLDDAPPPKRGRKKKHK